MDTDGKRALTIDRSGIMIVVARSDCHSRSVAAKCIHRTRVSTHVKLVEKRMRVASALGEVLQFDAQVVCAYQARRNVSVRGVGDVKLGRSPGWNLHRAERSSI